MSENIASFVDRTGARQEVSIDVSDYREAADHKLSLTQLYAQKYPTKEGEASALEQFAASTGIRVKADNKRGIPASSMREIIHGGVDKAAGTIVRGSGQGTATPSAKILFPEVLMQMVNEILTTNKDDVLNPWESAIAMRTNVVGPRVDQPRINLTAPEASASQPISQLSEPATMVSITLSDRSYYIPTRSIGLQISDEAQNSATIDLVALTMAAQARGERIRRLEASMVDIINGDTDLGINAVSFANASTFDSGLGSNQLTHKAWLKWLRANYQKMTVTHILTSLDAYLDIEARTGKPTAYTDLTTVANRMPGDFTLENAGIPSPRILLVPDAIIGADRAVGFDSQYALQEIINVSASYSAIEQFVLRRATGFRIDVGNAIFKLFDDAFTGLTLGA